MTEPKRPPNARGLHSLLAVAIRKRIVSHYTSEPRSDGYLHAVPCHCADCEQLRAELRRRGLECADSPPPPKRPPSARGQGRKPIPPEDRARVGSIRLTAAQWEKLHALGGAAWLRERIDRAKMKE